MTRNEVDNKSVKNQIKIFKAHTHTHTSVTYPLVTSKLLTHNPLDPILLTLNTLYPFLLIKP